MEWNTSFPLELEKKLFVLFKGIEIEWIHLERM